jgi:hypothetical protein
MAKKRAAAQGDGPGRTSSSGSCLWLVPFYFDRPKSNGRGSFQIVVEAANPDDAMQACHARLLKLRETTKLFDEPIAMFSDGLVRLTGSFEDGVIVNFEVPQAGGGRVSNLLPDPADTGAMVFLPANEPDETVEPFMQFGVEDERESGTRLAD